VERLRQFPHNEKQIQGEEILEDENETTPLTSKLTNDRYQDSSVNANCEILEQIIRPPNNALEGLHVSH
jgi:hypothetical protein